MNDGFIWEGKAYGYNASQAYFVCGGVILLPDGTLLGATGWTGSYLPRPTGFCQVTKPREKLRREPTPAVEFIHPRREGEFGPVFICNASHPMPKDAPDGFRWEHDGCHEVGDQEDGYPGGDIQRVECRDCEKRWKMELPQ